MITGDWSSQCWCFSRTREGLHYPVVCPIQWTPGTHFVLISIYLTCGLNPLNAPCVKILTALNVVFFFCNSFQTLGFEVPSQIYWWFLFFLMGRCLSLLVTCLFSGYWFLEWPKTFECGLDPSQVSLALVWRQNCVHHISTKCPVIYTSLFPLQVWNYRHWQSQDFVQGKFLQGKLNCFYFHYMKRKTWS